MIHIVGLGPGVAAGRTHQADAALNAADVLVGYSAYIALIRDAFSEKEIFESGMRGEKARCVEALRRSREGKRVALVCSGDAQVYGMASLVMELAHEGDDIAVVPGVTAALSAAALMGAPLSGDYACVSLSDLLTPWPVIENRLLHAALGDFVLALYNPGSHKRVGHLAAACEVLLRVLPGETPCGVAQNIGRDGENCATCTLDALKDASVDMFTTVIVGNRTTYEKGGKLITPRGYPL
ncbi:MAG: precorrin-3B C(17)-methyltransferase [Clostridia bacterium]